MYNLVLLWQPNLPHDFVVTVSVADQQHRLHQVQGGGTNPLIPKKRRLNE